MGISDSISRLRAYQRRHGLGATLRRFPIAMRRALVSREMVLFYCDLGTIRYCTFEMPNHASVEEYRRESDISTQDFLQITSFWNPDLARKNIRHRFELGASLWLIRLKEQLAGYGWSLQGQTVEPHFFCLTPDDVHLFDFHVFAQHRGRGLNPILVKQILQCLARNNVGRVFIEAAEWNDAQLISLAKTPFVRLGFAEKFRIFGHTWVCWKKHEDDTGNRADSVARRHFKDSFRSLS